MAPAWTVRAPVTKAGRGARVMSRPVWAAALVMGPVSRGDAAVRRDGRGRAAVGIRAVLTAAMVAASVPRRAHVSASRATQAQTARYRPRASWSRPTALGTASARTPTPPLPAAAGSGGRVHSAARDRRLVGRLRGWRPMLRRRYTRLGRRRRPRSVPRKGRSCVTRCRRRRGRRRRRRWRQAWRRRWRRQRRRALMTTPTSYRHHLRRHLCRHLPRTSSPIPPTSRTRL